MTFLVVILIGHPSDKPLSGIRKFLFNTSMFIACRIHLLMSGVYWINYNRRHDVNYSKYLGSNWKLTYEGAGTQVSNHISWLDVVVTLCKDKSSFISTAGVRKLPFVGKVAETI